MIDAYNIWLLKHNTDTTKRQTLGQFTYNIAAQPLYQIGSAEASIGTNSNKLRWATRGGYE